jgi:hypothetical protein
MGAGVKVTKMRKMTVLAVALVALVAVAPAAWAGLVSKTYEFRSDVFLEIGAVTDDGLRLDNVRFQMPSATAVRTAAEATATVSITNTSDTAKRVGMGIALFDDGGKMVGVVTGGTKLMPLKPGSQKSYKLIFEHVYVEAPRATTFQISVESKP